MPKKKDDLIRKIEEESTERQKALESKPIPKPLPLASPELWPGEHMDLGGFTLASAKRKRKARRRVIGIV